MSRTVEALAKTITYVSVAQSTIPHAPVSLLAALHRTRARTAAPALATAPARQGAHTDEGWPRLPNARPPTSCRESGSVVLPKATTSLKKKRAEYRGHSTHEAGGRPLSRRPSPAPSTILPLPFTVFSHHFASHHLDCSLGFFSVSLPISASCTPESFIKLTRIHVGYICCRGPFTSAHSYRTKVIYR
jgi:hypothetical protein